MKCNENINEMIQCENCYEWYHYKCLNLNFNEGNGMEVRFKCGFKPCHNGERIYQISDNVVQHMAHVQC